MHNGCVNTHLKALKRKKLLLFSQLTLSHGVCVPLSTDKACENIVRQRIVNRNVQNQSTTLPLLQLLQLALAINNEN